MISSVSWVKKGAAKEIPTLYEEEPQKKPKKKKNQNPQDKYSMEEYDDEDDLEFMTNAVEGLMMYKNEKDDPYLSAVSRESAQELEDFLIQPNDMLLLCAVSEEDEISHLDVYVHENESGNIFVHHDYLLPAFPLSLAWMDFPVGGAEISGNREKTNMVAVGSFECYIEIWDLDVVNSPAPLALLGGPKNPEDIGNSGEEQVELVKGSHSDSVIGLSWNTHQRNFLASASADCTTKLWDLRDGRCIKTYEHEDKIQTILWNPVEPPILAYGGYGGNLYITDVRTPATTNKGGGGMKTTLGSDIESLQWLPSPHHSHILVGTEDGTLFCFDILGDLSKPLWSLLVHPQSPVQALSLSPSVPGLLASGSSEKNCPLKLWDISSGGPVGICSCGDIGSVFSVRFSQEKPFLMAVGTNSSKPVLVNTMEFPEIQEKYKNWAPSQTQTTFTSAQFGIPTTPTQTTTTSTQGPTTTTTTSTQVLTTTTTKPKKKKNRRKRK